MNQIIGYGLLGWFLIVLTGIGSIVFRRFVEWLRTPGSTAPQVAVPTEVPLQISVSERLAEETKVLKAEHAEKMSLIDEMPLPDEDRRALMNDEEERFANKMRDVLSGLR